MTSTAPPYLTGRSKRRLSVVSTMSEQSLALHAIEPQCHDATVNDPSRKRRKSVTFNAVAQVFSGVPLSNVENIPQEVDVISKRRLSNASTISITYAAMPSISPSYSSSNISPFHVNSTREELPHCSVEYVANDPTSGDVYYATPSPRKRRPSVTLSPPSSDILSPSMATDPLSLPHKSSSLSSHHTNVPFSNPIPNLDDIRDYEKPLSPNFPHQRHGADLCAEVNDRIKVTFGLPKFDISTHMLHRNYIARTLYFSPMQECVAMLDASVVALLPSTFPPSPPFALDTFAIRQAPGKGLGLFAQRPINNNELILAERPVVLTPFILDATLRQQQVYSDMLRKLSPELLKQLKGLSSLSKNEGLYEVIIRSNALAITLPVPNGEFAELQTHRGVFLQSSRCNHSCCPNAKWEWDEKTYSLIITAVRPISAGEEITMAYVAPQLPFRDRKDALLRMYDFECLCPSCVMPEESIQKSDMARETLAGFWDPNSRRLLPSFKEWCSDPSLPSDVLISAHLQALAFINREGLEGLDTHPGSPHPQRDIGRHIDYIAMCFGALKDVENFRTWIGKAAEARELGKDSSEERLAFMKWMSNPLAFPAWGRRMGSCYSGADFREESFEIRRINEYPSFGMFELV